jgi:hypothetical protein
MEEVGQRVTILKMEVRLGVWKEYFEEKFSLDIISSNTLTVCLLMSLCSEIL